MNTTENSTPAAEGATTGDPSGAAAGLFASLWTLENEFPDAEVSFNMPWTQRLTVQRDGIRYHVEQYDRHGCGYRFAVCAELPTVDRYGQSTTEMQAPGYSKALETWPEAVSLLRRVMRADPRQSPA